jgi:hypothetical protein
MLSSVTGCETLGGLGVVATTDLLGAMRLAEMRPFPGSRDRCTRCPHITRDPRSVRMDDSYRVSAIPACILADVRTRGTDAYGNPFVPRTDEAGGAPLRCCLRESWPGERIGLMAWSPFPWSGPYAEVGPVFVHADACDGYPTSDRWPPAYRGRRQVLRAYGQSQSIVAAVVAEPDEIDAALDELLARDDVDFVHARNVAHGCWMLTVSR